MSNNLLRAINIYKDELVKEQLDEETLDLIEELTNSKQG